MRPTLLSNTIKAIYRGSKRAVCIEGAPGGGKTTLVRQIAKELDVHFILKHMPTMPLEDFGVPDMMTNNPTFGYKLPEWFPYKGSKWDDGRGGILLMDDRNQCGADLQKVFAHMQQERDLHGFPMADGWMVISTGNRQEDRAGANKVLSHLADRENTYKFDAHLDDWTTWAIDNDVKPEVISFIRFKPDLLHDFQAQRAKNATPRGWVEGVSDMIGVVPHEAEYETFCGAVGDGPAAEFTGFVKIWRKLPNPDNILLNPTTADVPTDPMTLCALAGSIAHRATVANFERVCTYAERMPPEYSVLAISYAARKSPELASTGAFTKWAVAHQDVLF